MGTVGGGRISRRLDESFAIAYECLPFGDAGLFLHRQRTDKAVGGIDAYLNGVN